jgi:hypothetical protein
LHQHQSSRNLHLHYLAKNMSTQHCLSLITAGSDHPPVLEPQMVLTLLLALLVLPLDVFALSHVHAPLPHMPS